MSLTLRGVEALLVWVRLLSQVADAMIKAGVTTPDIHKVLADDGFFLGELPA